MFWRRVIEPQANMRAVLPVVIEMVGALLNPTEKTKLPEKVSVTEAHR
jgi:hypothetical protein